MHAVFSVIISTCCIAKAKSAAKVFCSDDPLECRLQPTLTQHQGETQQGEITQGQVIEQARNPKDLFRIILGS